MPVLTLYYTIPSFNDLEEDVFRKHNGEKEKMLVTSIFSFSHHVFYPFIIFEYFQFRHTEILLLGKLK